jgi:hypothetical protein
MVRQQVIAAFPATGKSHYASRHYGVADSDSSDFSGRPDWPENYVEHIQGLVAEGATVLTSTHAEVRQALVGAGVSFLLVYPDAACRDEYRDRMVLRGSSLSLIEAVLTNWDGWLSDCREQQGCEHIELRCGEHLSDVISGRRREPLNIAARNMQVDWE